MAFSCLKDSDFFESELKGKLGNKNIGCMLFVYATVYSVLYVTVYGVVTRCRKGCRLSLTHHRRISMQLKNLISEFVLSCQAAGLSEKTISWYVGSLNHYQTFVQGEGSEWCTVSSLRSYFASLRTQAPYESHPIRPAESRPISVETILSYGRALKRFCNWLVEEGYIDSSPMSRVRLPKRPKHIPKDVSSDDIKALLNVANHPRDKAIILFLASTGVRASELRNLRLQDIDLSQRLALVRGKGKKERFVFFDKHTNIALMKWLEKRPETAESWLFTTLTTGTQLTEAGLRQIFRRLTKKAGITNPVSPHRFRHAFAKRWMMQGGDEFSLATILGHEDIATTRIYSQYRLTELKEKYVKIMR